MPDSIDHDTLDDLDGSDTLSEAGDDGDGGDNSNIGETDSIYDGTNSFDAWG